VKLRFCRPFRWISACTARAGEAGTAPPHSQNSGWKEKSAERNKTGKEDGDVSNCNCNFRRCGFLTALTHLKNGKNRGRDRLFLPTNSRSTTTAWDWSSRTRKGWLNFSTRPENFTQTPSCRLTRLFVSGDRVITEWTLQCNLHGALLRSLLTNASSLAARSLDRAHRQRKRLPIGRTIYDGLTSRRTALAFLFHRMGADCETLASSDAALSLFRPFAVRGVVPRACCFSAGFHSPSISPSLSNR